MRDALKKQGMISAREAARAAGVSVYTIYNWIKTSKVTGRRAAGHWWVSEESLAAHVGPDVLTSLKAMREEGGA
jgi:hypothetical protein